MEVQFAHICHTVFLDCDAKSRSLGPTLPIARKERVARSLNLVNAASRTASAKGEIPQ